MGKEKKKAVPKETQQQQKPELTRPRHFFVIRKRNNRARVMQIKRDNGVIIIVPVRVVQCED